jgi:hypothetical protein
MPPCFVTASSMPVKSFLRTPEGNVIYEDMGHKGQKVLLVILGSSTVNSIF